jgi:hypothetical protein
MSSIYSALREIYSQLGTPLESDCDPGLIENALVQAGFSLGVDAGRLIATREGVPQAIEPALRTLALRPEMQGNFVLPISRVTKLSQLKNPRRKAEFIEQRGLPEFSRLVADKK